MTNQPTPADAERAGQKAAGHYDASYSHFAATIYQEIRSEVFGDDLGQNSWLTAPDLKRFAEGLELESTHRLLDVACGSGGPLLRVAQWAQCQVVGIDIHADAVATATAMARAQGLEHRARFERHDASQPLPFPDQSFDGLICIDAINHLPDRRLVFSEWARVLEPGRRLVFTDPIVVTGALTNAEIAVRSSAGFYLFVPRGEDERLLAAAGLDVLSVEDLTAQMAEVAGRRRIAREKRAAVLREIEGDATFESEQAFYRVAETLASERRLSRFAYLVERPK